LRQYATLCHVLNVLAMHQIKYLSYFICLAVRQNIYKFYSGWATGLLTVLLISSLTILGFREYLLTIFLVKILKILKQNYFRNRCNLKVNNYSGLK